MYIRVPSDRDARDYRVRQSGNLGDFYITSWAHVGTHESFDYYRSRHNLFEGYSVRIEYDAATATQTHYRGKTDWANIENKEERFTEVDQEILDDLSRITFPHPTDDWQISPDLLCSGISSLTATQPFCHSDGMPITVSGHCLETVM